MITTHPPIPRGNWLPGFEDISSLAAQMVDRVRPSVVQVVSAGRGGGAGVIWQPGGAILTNNHVVAGEGRTIRVILTDDRTFDATVVGRDPFLDLALLTVEAADLSAVPIGDSTRLRVGELVFAIGHPWGQRGVVTAGIVSGLGVVPIAGGSRVTPYIRSDVLLAPGNSGGPLLSAEGAVIGINAMIFGGDLAVAIPSHVVNAWLARLSGRRVVLGIQVQQVELPPVVRGERQPERSSGLLICAVESGGMADRAGLLVGDLLLEVAGRPVEDGAALRDALILDQAATILRLRLLRGGALHDIEALIESSEAGG